MRGRWSRLLRRGLLGFGAVFLLIQLLPFGREHANPPVEAVAPWPDERTRLIATRSCFDCHSNQTKWAWYTHIAPISWAVQRDVYRAREKLNFTEWEESQQIEKAPEKVLSGEMPLQTYLLAHPEARLTTEERQALAAGLRSLEDTEGRDDRQEEVEPEEDEADEAEDAKEPGDEGGESGRGRDRNRGRGGRN